MKDTEDRIALREPSPSAPLARERIANHRRVPIEKVLAACPRRAIAVGGDAKAMHTALLRHVHDGQKPRVSLRASYACVAAKGAAAVHRRRRSPRSSRLDDNMCGRSPISAKRGHSLLDHDVRLRAWRYSRLVTGG